MKKQPHIIFIDTDQQRADTIKATGSQWMITPHLDQLASEACVFTKAFTMAATCGSNRASMYSGLYPHNLGVYGFDSYSGKFNWIHRLNDVGYTCTSIGKTHTSGNQHGYAQRIGEQHNKSQPYFVETEKFPIGPKTLH